MSPKPFKSHMFTKMCKKSHFWPKIPNMVIWTQISQKMENFELFFLEMKILTNSFPDCYQTLSNNDFLERYSQITKNWLSGPTVGKIAVISVGRTSRCFPPSFGYLK